MSIKSNFNKVMEFNRAFDMVSSEPKEYGGYFEDSEGNIQFNPFKNIRNLIFRDSPNTIRLRLDLIKEEVGELSDAILQNDIIEQRDACADILYVVYGMADVLGIAIDDIFSNKIQEKAIKYNTNNTSENNKFVDIIMKASNNGIKNITNFNYMKYFSKVFIEFDISSKSIPEMKNIIINKLNKIYMDLESNCLIEIEIVNILDKFKNISENIYELLGWTYIMTLVLGVNADYDFDIVHNSNMSKLCATEADAKATVADYEAKYRSGTSPYDSPYYYYLNGLDKWIVKNLSTGKALKNIKYQKVCFKNSRFVF
jgi:predicted HAD superfamily Cof-like phosphohydrolase